MDPHGHNMCHKHAKCIVEHRYAPFKGGCEVCITRFHHVENETLIANRKLLGAPLILWFRKVLKVFRQYKFEGPV